MVKFKVVNNELTINKEITRLDRFALDIINILKKYTNYIIISGYVSIFFGRSRATEDIDMIIEKVSFDKFKEIHNELIKNGFICMQSSKVEDISDYLGRGDSVRYVEGEDLLPPEMEIKFENNKKIITHPSGHVDELEKKDLEIFRNFLIQRKEEMLSFYTESMPYLKAQHDYEEMLMKIDECRFKRASYQMQFAMMMNPPQEDPASPEELREELKQEAGRKLKKS